MNRFIDLVVLVSELIRENDKSYNEINEELTHRGYSPEEIEQARCWMTSNSLGTGGADFPTGQNAVRVLSRFERMSLGSESYGYLLRLLNLGIIDVEQFERIMLRVIPMGPEKVTLSDVKAIVSAVVFDQFGRDFESELFDDFDEEMPPS